MHENIRLADTPKEALEGFLVELRDEYIPWYEHSVTRIHWTWLPIHVFALFSGFATAILAAFMREDSFSAFGPMRVALVLLPALGSAAVTLTSQARLHDWCRLRESGRRAMQDLYNEGTAQFAAAESDEDYSSIHSQLAKGVGEIEKEQGTGWFSLASEPTRDSRRDPVVRGKRTGRSSQTGSDND